MKSLLKFTLFWLLFTFSLVCISKGQDFELVGLVDNKLVLIDSTSGTLQVLTNINNMAVGDHVNLTYNSENGLYYSILSPNEAPKLVSISKEGDYQIIGTLMYNGNPVPLCDAIGYNAVRNKLYAGASLNGGIPQNDFYAESIIEVDPLTAVCTFVTEISTNLPLPDIDVMAFQGDILYFFDGNPPSPNFLYFYKLDFNNLGTISFPQVIYQSTYINIEDFTVTNQNIYFTESRNLRRFNLNNGTMHFIGVTHSSAEFNGRLIRGIGKFFPCEPPMIDLGSDTTLCGNATLTFDFEIPNSTYLWQDGNTNPIYTINSPGQYFLTIQNECGAASDTLNVVYKDFPEIEIFNDTTLCAGEILYLDVTNSEATYLWQDGSTNPTYTVNSPGLYKVIVTSYCGTVSDSIDVKYNIVPEFNLGRDTILCPGAELHLTLSFPNSTYLWQDGSTDPVYHIKSPGQYYVTIENSCGKSTDSINVEYRNLESVFIPNLFTPNGDQWNQSFEIDDRLLESSVRIYNRWGVLVYVSHSYMGGWEGGDLASGIYYYLIIDPCQNLYKGPLTIKR